MPSQFHSVPQLVVLNAKIWSPHMPMPGANAVAISGGRITAVGRSDEILSLATAETLTIDAAGRFLVPGFNDAHVHLLHAGFCASGIDFRDTRDEEDFLARLRAYAQGLPPGKWILHGLWNHEAWPSGQYPTRHLLDRATGDHPTFLHRIDGHVAVANTLALLKAGITRDTPDPPGGRILRDRTGEPTGVLVESARALVGAVIPEPDAAECLKAARRATHWAAKHGITTVQSAGSMRELHALRQLHDRGELTVRVNWMVPWKNFEKQPPSELSSGWSKHLYTTAVKVFADGSLGARTALLFEPYDDTPSSRGLAIYNQRELFEIFERIHKAGFQVAVHAIGDCAVHMVLDAFERLLAHDPSPSHRHRIEHAQIILPEDRIRFAKLGLVASIQPWHCIDDMPWIQHRIGERIRHAYPYRSLKIAGVRVALGTDWPVAPLDPILTIYAAVTRRTLKGQPVGGWYPEECVSLEEAFTDYTLGSAHAEWTDHEKGRIAPGCLADLVLLSADPFTLPPDKLPEIRADLTICGGRITHAAI